MFKKGKRGQLQLSFGMIFSIIIIIATIGIAFYVISNFVQFGKCIDAGSFYVDLEEEVDKAWASPITKTIYSGNVPSGVEEVCFGNLTGINRNTYAKEWENLRHFVNHDANVFIYPTTQACGNSLIYFKLDHAYSTEFFCVSAVNGKVGVKLNKEFDDALVKIEK